MADERQTSSIANAKEGDSKGVYLFGLGARMLQPRSWLSGAGCGSTTMKDNLGGDGKENPRAGSKFRAVAVVTGQAVGQQPCLLHPSPAL